MTPTLLAAAATDPGRKRTINEDAYCCASPVFVVADGMGGHDAGDRASAAVVSAFAPLCGLDAVRPPDVVTAVRAAHRDVAQIADGTQRGAGSTLTGVALVNANDTPQWLLMNCGDSRVYRWLNGVLDQLTVDHSLVQEMIDQGELHPDDARNRQPRNVITRAMGAEGSVPDYWLMPVITGERLLIASDGLFTEVPDPAIAQRLGSGLDPQLAARTLVEDALAAGGRDNVTVIVLDVVAGGVAGPGEGSGQ